MSNIVLADLFEEVVDLDTIPEDSIYFADPNDDPLEDIAPSLHYIRADGQEGVFYDEDTEIGKVLTAVILDVTRTRALWPPKEQSEDLYARLQDFPRSGGPICKNDDVSGHPEARFHPDLTETQKATLRSLGAGNCSNCELTKRGCRGGRKLLLFAQQWDEPVALQVSGTSIGSITALFRKDFKLKGKSLAVFSRPVQLFFEKQTGTDKSGASIKYYQMQAKAGSFLPAEQVKQLEALRDAYRQQYGHEETASGAAENVMIDVQYPPSSADEDIPEDPSVYIPPTQGRLL